MNISNFPTNPLPDGLTARPATLDDLDAAVALMNRVSRHESGRDRHKADDVRGEWTSPHFNMATDTLSVWNVDGAMVGYVELWRIPAERMRFWLRVDPAHDLDTLGGYLAAWAEAQGRANLGRTPDGVRVVLHAGHKAGVPGVDALFERAGFRVVRYIYRMRIDMTADPAPPAVPDGFALRPYRHPADVEQLVWVDRESFRDHWGYVDVPHAEIIDDFNHWFAEDKLMDPALTTFVVDATSGALAGAVICRLEDTGDPDAGYVEMLAVLRPYRKRGLGNALLRWAFHTLHQRGKAAVTLYVDAASLTGALRLYERAGMRMVETNTRYEKVLRPGISRMTTSIEPVQEPQGDDRHNGSHK